MTEKPLYHADGTRVRWQYGGKRDVLQTYVNLHEGKLGMHWLWAAICRINAGDPEEDVMADYGYVRESTGNRGE